MKDRGRPGLFYGFPKRGRPETSRKTLGPGTPRSEGGPPMFENRFVWV